MERLPLFAFTLLLSTLALSPARGQSGSLDATFAPTIAGDFVTAAVPQADGKIIVVGSFVQADGTARRNIARLQADGTLDTSFKPGLGANATIESAVVQPDGNILIAGEFTNFAGVAKRGLCRIFADGKPGHTDGSIDPSFSTGSGISGYVYCLALQANGAVVLGGSFTSINGVACHGLARVSSTGAVDLSFTSHNFDNAIYSLAVQADGSILVGGNFSTVDGTTQRGLVRLSATGATDTAFNVNLGASSFVECLLVQPDGRIAVGGSVAASGGVTFTPLLRFNSNGTADSTFHPGIAANYDLKSMALQADGKIIATGGYRNSGVDVGVVTRLQSNGSPDPTFFGASPNAYVYGVALQGDGSILIGGYFTKIGSTSQAGLARLANDPASSSLNRVSDTTVDWIRAAAAPEISSATFSAGATNLGVGARIAGGWEITGLNLSSTDVLTVSGTTVGGFLNGSGGIVSQTLSQPAAGTVDASFSPLVTPKNGVVQAIALSGSGRAIIGGTFSNYGGLPAQNILQLKSDGTPDFSFNPGSGIVGSISGFSVQPNDSKILVFGPFTLVNGIAQSNLARLNSDGTRDSGFVPTNPGSGSTVTAVYAQPLPMAETTGHILVAGSVPITGTSPQTYNYYLALLKSDGSVDANFSALPTTTAAVTTGPDNNINVIAVQADNKILIGGAFKTYLGIAKSSIARLTPTNTLDTTFTAATDKTVNCIAIQADHDNKILLGGNFAKVTTTAANDTTVSNSAGLARVDSTGKPDTTFNATIGSVGAVQTIALSTGATPSESRILVGGSFTTINGTAAKGIARLKADDGSVDTTFNATISGASATVDSIMIRPTGEILIGGSFTTVKDANGNDVAANGIALLDSTGALVQEPTFHSGAGLNHPISSIATQGDGRLIVTGNFASVGGQTIGDDPTTASPTSYIARLAANGAADTAYGTSSTTTSTTIDGPVTAAAIQSDGKMVIGGQFSTIAAAVTNSSGNPSANSFAQKGITRLNPDGTVELTFQPGAGVTGYVNCVALQPDGKILIGGNFPTVGGTTTPLVAASTEANLARLNSDGSVDTATDADTTSVFKTGLGVSGTVYSVAVQFDKHILVGGNFHSAGGVAQLGLVRLMPNGSVEDSATFNAGAGAGADGAVTCLALQADGKILVGGFFNGFGTSTAANFVRLLSNGQPDPNFNIGSGADGSVSSITLQANGKIFIAGDFVNFNGSAARHFVRLNLDGSVDTTFDKDADPNKNQSDASADGPVDALALQADGSVLAAGSFSTIDGVAKSAIARLANNPATSSLAVIVPAATADSPLPPPNSIEWTRNGSAPEVSQVLFQNSTDGGVTWSNLGSGSRTGDGTVWKLDFTLPYFGTIRAIGQTDSGVLNSGSGIVQLTKPYNFAGPPPDIVVTEVSTNSVKAPYARPGDILTVKFTATSPIANETVATPTVLIDGKVTTVGTGAGANSWIAATTVTSAFPQGPISYSITAMDANSNTATKTDSAAVIVDTIPPVLDTSGVPTNIYSVTVLPNFVALNAVTATDANTTDATPPVTITQSPSAGAGAPAGTQVVTFTATDAAGNTSQASVRIRFSASTTASVAKVTDTPPGQTTQFRYGSFGAPQTGATGGKLANGTTSVPAVFGSDGSVLYKVGSAPVTGSTAIVSSLGQPSGDAAVVTLKNGVGGITAANNSVLLTGLAAGAPRIAAQTNTFYRGLPVGVTIKAFITIDGQGTDTFFLCRLQGSGVAASNNLALCVAPAAGGVNLLVRTGMKVSDNTVSVIGTLVGSKGTLAARRWRVSDTEFGVRLTYAGKAKAEAIYVIPSTATGPANWTLLAQTGASTGIPDLNNAVITSFGLPGFGPNAFAVTANLKNGGEVKTANNAALLVGAIGGSAPTVLVSKGDVVPTANDAEGNPGPAATVKALGDPIVGSGLKVACPLTLGTPASRAGILYAADGATPKIIANAGAPVPDVGEAKSRNWASFPSLVLPSNADGGPVFTATLELRKSIGSGSNVLPAVTKANNFGLWSVTGVDTLHQVLIPGDMLTGIGTAALTVKSFTALQPSAGSIGAASGFDNEGNVAAVVEFTDGFQYLLLLALPN